MPVSSMPSHAAPQEKAGMSWLVVDNILASDAESILAIVHLSCESMLRNGCRGERRRDFPSGAVSSISSRQSPSTSAHQAGTFPIEVHNAGKEPIAPIAVVVVASVAAIPPQPSTGSRLGM